MAGHEIKKNKTLLVIGAFLFILTLATFYYAWQNNSGMATATTTMVLVIITGFYAWNTQVQADEMHRQADTMEKQFTLTAKSIKRDRITKEMDLLILPLRAIYKEIEFRGIDENWWAWQYKTGTETNPSAADKFRNAVDSVDQNKYLAPRNLYPLIDDFIVQLRNMKKNDEVLRGLLKRAAKNLYYNDGNLVEKRYQDLTTELQALDNGDGNSPGDI